MEVSMMPPMQAAGSFAALEAAIDTDNDAALEQWFVEHRMWLCLSSKGLHMNELRVSPKPLAPRQRELIRRVIDAHWVLIGANDDDPPPTDILSFCINKPIPPKSTPRPRPPRCKKPKAV